MLDPLAVLLLLLRKRAGIVLGLLIILADITVNWTVLLTIGGNPLFGVVNQTLFADGRSERFETAATAVL